MDRLFTLTIFSMILLANTHSMIMRNNALMSKMVSRFQGKENKDTREKRDRSRNQQRDREAEAGDREETQQQGNQEHVLSLMQNVLCKNFPSIPCELITKDDTLKHLIEKSIQQLKYKKLTMERTTASPNYQLSLFPVINSEDLSKFLQVNNAGLFKQKTKPNKQKKPAQEKNFWSNNTRMNKTKTAAVYSGRQKLRKFYPHKIKYKDKNDKRDFADYSDEKLSMSVENLHEHGTNVKRKHFSYRGEPSDPPVWRIDYMKHGEPSLNMFGYESDSLKGKIIRTGPNVIVDDIVEQAARRDVLHPDVYIKKNYPRKNIRDISEGME